DNNKPKMQELTKVELEIMQIIWKLDGEFIIRDVHDNMPEPKPAYNTVSTMVRILDSKGFLTHKTYGHTNVYMAAVTKDEYTGRFMQGVLNSFFGGSVSRLVTFFSDNKNLSVKEADEIINMLNKK
ncbi:MAG: BlaI/MecI/CopY family transcriptional regulator, partial [Bacteroidaceae bacterium]|nr:BlaI/MecI/CopY family transcriptional regulator [Bacteroidaceae bacterium]